MTKDGKRLFKVALSLVERLRRAGFEAYFVGGMVRDMVMGQEPKDYDIATSARPEQICRLFGRTINVGAQFGVMLVVQEGLPIEVATFRADGAYEDGRHPTSVIYSTHIREDVLRRDFTINGLAYDPIKDEILDFVGGRTDIEARLIRTIGDPHQRLGEDHLRLMRAVRFSVKLGFSIEAQTERAIAEMAPLISKVSGERIRDELSRILTQGKAGQGIRLLQRTGLLRVILPEVEALVGVAQPEEFHPEGDVFEHTLVMLDLLKEGASQELALAAMLHDIGKPPTLTHGPDRIRFHGHARQGAVMAEEICRRLRLPNRSLERVRDLVAMHMHFINIQQMRRSRLIRFLRTEGFAEHLELHRLDCLAAHGNLDNYWFAKSALEELPPEMLRPCHRLLTGDELKEMGFKPGPLFKDMLDQVEDAYLEGLIGRPEEARALVRERFGHRLTSDEPGPSEED